MGRGVPGIDGSAFVGGVCHFHYRAGVCAVVNARRGRRKIVFAARHRLYFGNHGLARDRIDRDAGVVLSHAVERAAQGQRSTADRVD